MILISVCEWVKNKLGSERQVQLYYKTFLFS